MNDPNQTPQHENDRPVAFCQHCGKPLDRETVRIVGPAVYCEPCLAARLAGATGPAGPFSAAPPTDPGSAYPGAAPPWSAAPMLPDQPNPGLAALLGFLPGVGAMYNGQYAKGIVHLVVFAVLITLSNANGIFSLFVAGWVFYMIIEAHHTAKARRDGLPLPNPFGLNDIGERLGFGRAWSSGQGVAGVVQDVAQTASSAFNGAPPPSNVPPSTAGAAPPQPPPPSSYAGAQASASTVQPGASTGNWGSPVNTYRNPGEYGYAYTQPPGQSYGYGAPVPPYASPYAPISNDPAIIAPANRFPAGAVWLIGLGSLFLLTTTGIFHGFPGTALVGFTLIGLGVWIFTRRMLDTGVGLSDDGTPAYRLRVLRALRVSVWLMLIGILFLLNSFDLVTWHRSWPLLIILAGVVALLERTAYNSAASATFAPWPPASGPSYPPPTEPAPAAPSSTNPTHMEDSHPEGN